MARDAPAACPAQREVIGPLIREERSADFQSIAQVHRRAFGRDDEAVLVERLRADPAFDARLSLVAESNDAVVGHLLLNPARIECNGTTVPVLALAPMGVVPEYQRRGIGSQLVDDAVRRARELGHGAIVVLGHAEFYPRFGFLRADTFGIVAPFPVPSEAFMVLPLVERSLEGVRGTVRYGAAFGCGA